MTATDQSPSRLPEQDRIDAILAADGKAREYLVDDFARAKLTTYRRIAVALCRKAGLDPVRHGDEATQIVAMECNRMLTEVIADPARLAREVTSWDGRLYTRAKPKLRSYGDGAASGQSASGTTALARRQRELTRTRVALRAELEREPSDVEIVDGTNERMRRLRKDPARQSMISTVEDLRPVGVVPLLETDQESTFEDETPALAPHEGRRVVTLLHEAAVEIDPVLATVVVAWLGGVYDPSVGAPRELEDVAAHVHITRARAAQYIAQAQSLAVTVLSQRFGIWGDQKESS